MRVFLLDKRIVRLKHFQFSWASYALLMGIQQTVPNLLLEIVADTLPMRAEDLHKFVPAHSLNLEDFNGTKFLNPA
jgi:hypothetical protein